MTDEDKKLMSYAVRLLAGKPYHSSEFKEKLLNRSKNLDLIEDTIKKLKNYKYLNDNEYIRMYISDSLILKPQSGRLIKRKLLQKKIPEEEIDIQLESLNIDEREMALKAYRKKIKSLKNYTPEKQREKLFRFLLSRGFTTDVVVNVINKI